MCNLERVDGVEFRGQWRDQDDEIEKCERIPGAEGMG
jgi:hypothetical protein